MPKGPWYRKASIASFSAALIFGLSACSAQPEAKKSSRNLLDAAALAQATQLSVAKDDAGEGDAWIARLEKRGEGWFLLSGPHGEALKDSVADSRWVNHFLDTLRTLQSPSAAPPSAPATYGLERPLFRLEWKTAGSARQSIFIGNDAPEGAIFARVDESPQVILIHGAAVRMLGQLDSFGRLREKRLFTFEFDDIDEVVVEWGAGKKQQLYFQRQGDAWADLQNVRYRGEALDRILSAFAAISHLQIADFTDLAPSVHAVRAAPARSAGRAVSSPRLIVRMRTREGHEHRLELRSEPGHATAQISNRPGARFELYPQAVHWISKLRKLPARADLGDRPVKSRR